MKTFKEIYEAKRATQKDALRAFLKDPRNDKKRAAVNKAFPGPKQSKDKLRSVLKAGKTMTGEKPAEIEINPKMGDKTTCQTYIHLVKYTYENTYANERGLQRRLARYLL